VSVSGASEAWKRWKHLSVGTGGRGEPLIYAVNSPFKPGATPTRIPDRADFLWETGPDLVNTTDFAMGYITNPARSGQTENGEWVVVVNNGHYNGQTDGSNAGLLVLNALNGDVLKRIPLPGGYSAGRGLGGVTLVRNSDKRIVAAYAGDANGNLWRFNLKGTSNNWGVSYGKPVFTTANNRPIYGSPAWQAHPKGGTIVVVATGIMLEDTDLGDTATTESIYGIWDPTPIGANDESPFQTVLPSNLLVQEVLTSTGETEEGNTFYKISKNKIDWDTHRGWRMQLGHTHTGERSIAEVQNMQTSVVISTTVLSRPANADAEMCTVSDLPGNYIYILNALEASNRKSIDVDGDGKLDDFSVGYYPAGGFSRGVAVVRQVPPAPDLLPDPNDPTDPQDPSDPTKPLRSEKDRRKYSPDEGGGESDPTPQKCENTKAIAIGTEDPTGTLGVYCPITGWSRTQYQLSAPPGL
jgi:Tfp pilus tip-associated adhesin PilY1